MLCLCMSAVITTCNVHESSHNLCHLCYPPYPVRLPSPHQHHDCFVTYPNMQTVCVFFCYFYGCFFFFFLNIIIYLPIISAHKKNYYMYPMFLFYLFFSCLSTTKKFTLTAYQTGFLHTCKSHVMMSTHVAPIRKRQSVFLFVYYPSAYAAKPREWFTIGLAKMMIL